MFLSLILFFFRRSPFLNRLGLLLFAFCIGLEYLRIGLEWYFFVLTLIFLGGVIVVFTYASACTNYFRFSYQRSKLIKLFLGLRILCFYMKGVKSVLGGELYLALKGAFSGFARGRLVIMGLVLILVLVILVKLVKLEDGPLKSRFYNFRN